MTTYDGQMTELEELRKRLNEALKDLDALQTAAMVAHARGLQGKPLGPDPREGKGAAYDPREEVK
jgi:hypothetical protein